MRDRVLDLMRGLWRDQQPAAVAMGSSSGLQGQGGIMGSDGVQQDAKWNNGITESQTFGWEGILKPISSHPPAMNRNTFHYPRLL